MPSRRHLEITVWVLFFISTASYIFGSGILDTALSETQENIDTGKVALGWILELINSLAVILIWVLMYPLLKKHAETVALGYMAFRLFEGILLAIGTIAALSIARTGGPGFAWFPTALEAIDTLSFDIAMLFLGFGSLLLCINLFAWRIIPRIISWIGILGYLGLMTWSIINLHGISANMILFAPGAIFEIVFPLWLIFKGFSDSRE